MGCKKLAGHATRIHERIRSGSDFSGVSDHSGATETILSRRNHQGYLLLTEDRLKR
jgi:hypothetical protein